MIACNGRGWFRTRDSSLQVKMTGLFDCAIKPRTVAQNCLSSSKRISTSSKRIRDCFCCFGFFEEATFAEVDVDFVTCANFLVLGPLTFGAADLKKDLIVPCRPLFR